MNITEFLEHVTYTHDFSIIHNLIISFVRLFLVRQPPLEQGVNTNCESSRGDWLLM